MRIRIGTRKSRLALVQTGLVKEKIEAAFPDAEVELVELSTKGDEDLERALTSFGGKGAFTRELEEALLREEIDLAVHSAKDMPLEFPDGLGIGAVLPRADARDVFVTLEGARLCDLAAGSVVGTGSLRRELQVKAVNPGVKVRLLRGNVLTRLRKLKEGQYDGILLAAAGLDRLGLTDGGTFHLEYLDPERFLPAAGQGILAVEAKKGRMTEVLAAIHCEKAGLLLEAERSFLSAIGGSCNAPAAGLCWWTKDGVEMRVMYAKEGQEPRYALCREVWPERLSTGEAAAQDKSEGLAVAQDGRQAFTVEQARGRMRALGERLAREVRTGKVWLLGAGPGDMGLMTQRCLDCIRTADVIVYDNLVPVSALNEAKEDAELIYAGKRASHHHLRQEETNALLVKKALEGKRVARLKGGDPFVFGRGGEEAGELVKAGIPFEVVPGVSSAYAAAAYAGIPVTHRDFASSFHVITGHEGEGKESPALDYETLAREEGTLVFLMGLKNLPRIAGELIAGGKDPKTPAAVVQEGTTARQRVAVGTLLDIAEKAEKAGIGTPAVTVVGGVASLQKELSWYGGRPLSGVRVLLTGTPAMCEKQRAAFLQEGADPVSFSLVRTKAIEDVGLWKALEELSGYGWAVFTSRNGVELFFSQLRKRGVDVRSLASLRFAVIGEGTKEALAERGIYADFVPSRYSSADLAREWIPSLRMGERILLLRAREASAELTEALGSAGISYTEVSLYTTEVDGRKGEELLRILPQMDYVTLASASAAKAFAGMVKDPGRMEAKVICIGPVTERAAKKLGIPVCASASVYTAEGIRDAVRKDWEGWRQ